MLVEIKATGICHTDEFTLSGADPEGLFPAILGHEGAGVVVDVGPGVTSVAKGDHVIPLYTPECRQCKSCLSRKTNLCTAIRATQGKGVMPDGTSRFSIGERQDLPLHGLLDVRQPHGAAGDRGGEGPPGRARSTRSATSAAASPPAIGAVINTAKVEPGANVVVFGLGGIGLNVMQGARLAGADKIIGVDLNPAREPWRATLRHDPFRQPERARRAMLVAHPRRADQTAAPTTASTASAT